MIISLTVTPDAPSDFRLVNAIFDLIEPGASTHCRRIQHFDDGSTVHHHIRLDAQVTIIRR